MIAALLYIVTVGFYLFTNFQETSLKEAVICMVVVGIYCFWHLAIPPFAATPNFYTERAFGVVPFVSMWAILFPHFAINQNPTVTRTLGWIGLGAMTIILAIFKLFVR
ncbi:MULTISPECIES: hypothetical protein [Salinivibrio]|uniref:hypothetical protein n=1 Tax=Salinivibrio TaxID=51366 RepID=UPI00098790FB|nr:MULTISPECIES: hypothetical protein [Salinivibrio]OOE49373.1 hypothetical protein BZG11_11985 [Salinivibrio kushneri]OOE52142.1 hypothetical protein BZG10_06715 [Salinivibrio kushneri]OOF27430.1 hypothetical protein BZJ18_07945 [Salinivibrio sp. IB872]